MADIIVQQRVESDEEGVFTWLDVDQVGKFETTQKAKANIAENGRVGERYRVADVKWEGTLAEKDSTIITKKS